ncbi:MAG: hypothetical protein C0606_15035 [Hyphomicrobiales bacterium]|nr:MAG: hypothetical protein C0606_15035 [Hyphomicrobiales bacterium]
MSLNDDISALQRVSLFEDFADDQLRLLAFGAEDRDLSAGSVLYEQGDRADSAYVVVSGALELFGPNDEPIGRAGPGTLIGELALMVDTERTNRAVVNERTRVILIRRSLFRRILQEFPDLARRVQQDFTARLQETARGLARVQDRLDALDAEAESLFFRD